MRRILLLAIIAFVVMTSLANGAFGHLTKPPAEETWSWWINPEDSGNPVFMPRVVAHYYGANLVERAWVGDMVVGPHRVCSGPVLWGPKQTPRDTVVIRNFTGFFRSAALEVSHDVQERGPTALWQVDLRPKDIGQYTLSMVIRDDAGKVCATSWAKREVMGLHRHLVTLSEPRHGPWYTVKNPVILAIEVGEWVTLGWGAYGVLKAVLKKCARPLAKVAVAYAYKVASKVVKGALVRVHLRTEEIYYWRELQVWCNGPAERFSPVGFWPSLYRQREVLSATATYPDGTQSGFEDEEVAAYWTKELSLCGSCYAYQGVTLPKYFYNGPALRAKANSLADNPDYWRP